jgi:hypothetical protein
MAISTVAGDAEQVAKALAADLNAILRGPVCAS